MATSFKAPVQMSHGDIKRWATHAMAANARTITIAYVHASAATSRIVAEGQSKERAIRGGVSHKAQLIRTIRLRDKLSKDDTCRKNTKA